MPSAELRACLRLSGEHFILPTTVKAARGFHHHEKEALRQPHWGTCWTRNLTASLASLNIKGFTELLEYLQGMVVYLCIFFPQTHYAKRLKKEFVFSRVCPPWLPGTCTQATWVQCAHAHTQTLHGTSRSPLLLRPSVCNSTPSWPPFSELLRWKFHNSQEIKLWNLPPRLWCTHLGLCPRPQRFNPSSL